MCSLKSLLLATCVLVPGVAGAHHSFAEYDQNRIIELTGKLLVVAWQNPHVHFRLEARDQSGRAQIWDIESSSVSILRRTNATPENLRVGNTVKFAGWPSKRSPTRMLGTNVLTDRGELVLDLRAKPRWQTHAAGLETTWLKGATAGDRSLGLFRVWSSQFNDPEATPNALWRKDYPLTAAARKKLAAWDPTRDTVTPGCKPKGMPTIMEEPYPIEFINEGDTIVLRLEEYDTVRTIHMKGRKVDALPRTLLGHSTGRWEGKTLVVTTSRIDWPYLDPSGVPLSPAVTLLERFTPNDEGTRLNYTVVVTDPETLSQPIELKRAWVWRGGESVKPYNCVSR